jgi:chromosome segregation protein
MEISRLKLSGFKSFVEPAELRVEPGLTGVVGPNGCGKSNLLEAIRWVMGENSPKSMRSGGMEDVIFAGTEARPPRDFAEVVLQAKDDEGEELEVTRRIERGAGSAYRVNGRDVRAKDVALTFADAATGAHSPALVSQGKIAQVIAAKPAERRQMLEEAAGIAGLHVRRKDAESKLRQTENNLARLEDLMAGLDTQISSLKRQAKQAERYKKLSDQIKIAEARLLYARWRDAAAAAEEAREAAKLADQRVEQTQAATKEAKKQQQAAAETVAEARDELADRRDDASAHGHRMAALTSQLEAAEQRLADLDRQKTRLEEDRGNADRLTHDAAAALARLERELTISGDALAKDEERRPALTSLVDDAERASRAAELALAKATADHAGVEAEWRVVEAEIEQAKLRLGRLKGEMERQQGLTCKTARDIDGGAGAQIRSATGTR